MQNILYILYVCIYILVVFLFVSRLQSFLYSFFCNSIPVFKFKLIIKKFPIYKRFQCKFSITPEEGWPKYSTL